MNPMTSLFSLFFLLSSAFLWTSVFNLTYLIVFVISTVCPNLYSVHFTIFVCNLYLNFILSKRVSSTLICSLLNFAVRIVLPLCFYHSVPFRITWFLDSYWSTKISRSLFNPVSTISLGHSSLLIPFDISSNFLSQFTNHIRSQNNCFSFHFSIVFSFLLLIRMHVLFLIFHMYSILVSIFQFQFPLSLTSMLLLIGETKTSCFSTHGPI